MVVYFSNLVGNPKIGRQHLGKAEFGVAFWVSSSLGGWRSSLPGWDVCAEQQWERLKSAFCCGGTELDIPAVAQSGSFQHWIVLGDGGWWAREVWIPRELATVMVWDRQLSHLQGMYKGIGWPLNSAWPICFPLKIDLHRSKSPAIRSSGEDAWTCCRLEAAPALPLTFSPLASMLQSWWLFAAHTVQIFFFFLQHPAQHTGFLYVLMGIPISFSCHWFSLLAPSPFPRFFAYWIGALRTTTTKLLP